MSKKKKIILICIVVIIILLTIEWYLWYQKKQIECYQFYSFDRCGFSIIDKCNFIWIMKWIIKGREQCIYILPAQEWGSPIMYQ